MKSRTALKIIRSIQAAPELLQRYPRHTVKQALSTVYRAKRFASWVKSHVRIRLADRTAVKMPDRTYCFILNEDFDKL